MKTKINIGSKVLTDMGYSQNGNPPYKGYSIVKTELLLESIKKHTIKIGGDLDNFLEKIRICTLEGNISMYGTGSGDFLIGQSAEDRHKKDKPVE